jgi:acetamidase/formamidase
MEYVMTLRIIKQIMCVCLSLTLCNTIYAQHPTTSIQNHCLPFLAGLPDQALMMSAATLATNKQIHYILPATPQTTQWGIYDSNQKPVLIINPGDSVAIETMAASDNQIVPGTTINQLLQIQTAIPNRGPHTLTGPIYINHAKPGDVLKIHINKIVPRPYASNNNGPGKGLFPNEFGDSFVQYFYLDLKHKQLQFSPEINIPLAPFPGIMAVARKEPGQYDSVPPGPFGGNMDLRELTEGSTLYLPVFTNGALFWTGDSHAGQGNGEIDLTAMETAFAELNVTFDVIKNKALAWPRIETANAWIAMAYDHDLNKALIILKEQTLQLIIETQHVRQDQAQTIMLTQWNCPISEMVNGGIKGAYCIIPKNGHQKPMNALPKKDNAKMFVAYAKDPDVEQAMRSASKAMLNKIVTIKHLSPKEAYILASFAMDCRIAPFIAGDKEVHCMLAKNLWK